MRGVLKANGFGSVNEKPMGVDWNTEKVIPTNICAKGRHRSVANAEIQSKYITSKTKGEVYVCHVSQHDFWGKTCRGKCSECPK